MSSFNRTPSSTSRSSTFSSTPASASLTRHLSFLISDSKATAPNSNDFQRAQDLMQQSRAANKRTLPFDYKDANLALARVAQGQVPGVTPGLVNALIEGGASVSVARRKSGNILKMFKGQDQEDVRSDVLQQATRNCSDDVVMALAFHADKTSLDQSLPIAIMTNSTVKVSILLARGANASPLCNAFLDAVSHDKDDMVEILLREVNGACQSCRDKGLVQAAKMGFELTAHKLLGRGANVKFDNGAALRAAIASGAEDLAMQIASSPDLKGQAALLDAAASDAYKHKRYAILQVLLRAGAKGNATDNVLLNAVEAQQLQLVQDLVQGGALSVLSSTSMGACLCSSINTSRLDMLQTLLSGRPPQEPMAAALLHTHSLSNLRYVLQVADILLRSGLAGHDSVSEALLYTVNRSVAPSDEQPQLNLLHLFLSSGAADVNVRKGKAIMDAISRAQLDMLSLFLQPGFRVSTESRAQGLTCVMNLQPDKVKMQVIDMLLGKHNNGSGIATLAPQDEAFLVDTAMSAAARNLDLPVLELVSRYATPPTPFSTAVSSMIRKTDGWLSDRGLVVMHFLLEHGASGEGVEEAYLKAISLRNYQAVNLLDTVVDARARTRALSQIAGPSPSWIEANNLWILQTLCDGGCAGEPVDVALLEAVGIVSKGDGAIEAISMLLDSSANVNYQQGKAMQVAAASGAVEILKTMLPYGASRESVASAIYSAISAQNSEKRILKVVDVLVGEMETQAPKVKFNFKAVSNGQAPALIMCLRANPNSAQLAKRLCDLGCDPDEEITASIHDYQPMGQEVTTVFAWALSPVAAGQISSEVIVSLIEHKANVDYETSVSKSTPLILATKYGRRDIVRKLLSAKARPTTRDCFNATALYYAAQLGHLDIVKDLVKAKSLTNDGSLHEAARNLHSNVVAALVANGHDPNFRSSRPEHKGRTALEEVSLLGNGSISHARLEETMMSLADGKAKVLTPNGTRNCLFLAFDNPNPIPVTSVLLDRIMWRDLNDEKNVLIQEVKETGTRIFYSPSMFLKKGYSRCDNHQINHILKLLGDKQCVDRFYCEFGPGDAGAFQPEDAVGVPLAIAREEKKRRADAEKRRQEWEDHQRRLRRQQEEAEHKAQVDGWTQQQKMAQANLAHQHKMQQQTQMANQQLRAMQQKQAMKRQ